MFRVTIGHELLAHTTSSLEVSYHIACNFSGSRNSIIEEVYNLLLGYSYYTELVYIKINFI